MIYSCLCSKLFGQSKHLQILISYLHGILVAFFAPIIGNYICLNQHFVCYKPFLVHLIIFSFIFASLYNLYFSSEFSCDLETWIWNVLRQNYFHVIIKYCAFLVLCFKAGYFNFILFFVSNFFSIKSYQVNSTNILRFPI